MIKGRAVETQYEDKLTYFASITLNWFYHLSCRTNPIMLLSKKSTIFLIIYSNNTNRIFFFSVLGKLIPRRVYPHSG